MLRLTNFSDANGSYTIEMPTQGDWINSVSLSASTPATDNIPTGARFVILNATNTLYIRIGAAAAIPGTITTGTASELIISSTSGWPVARSLNSQISLLGSITTGTNLLTVSQIGYNPAGLNSNYSPTDGLTVNDTVTVAGAGAAGALLTTTITAINTSTNVVTLTANAGTTVTNAVVNKSVTTIGLVSPGTCIVTLMYYK